MMNAMENAMEQMDRDLTAVTEKDIYHAAWVRYIACWNAEQARADKNPENKIAWQRLQNVEAMMDAKGYRG